MADDALAHPTKICTGCRASLPITRFSRDASKPDGLQTRCKECRAANDRAHYQKRGEIIRDRSRKRFAANKAEISAKNRKWAVENAERMAEYRRDWRARNRDAERASARIRERERLKCAHRRLNRAISRGIWGALTAGKGGHRWEVIVGYGADALVAHLQRQFLPGMSWENYGAWHVDHVQPIAAFDFEAGGLGEIRRCWALSNLRPLWALDNHRKNARRVLLL